VEQIVTPGFGGGLKSGSSGSCEAELRKLRGVGEREAGEREAGCRGKGSAGGAMGDSMFADMSSNSGSEFKVPISDAERPLLCSNLY